MDKKYLLNNKQITDFIIRGYLTVKITLPSVFNEDIVSKLDHLNIAINPKTGKYSYIDENGNTVFLEDKNKLLELLPEVQKVWKQPEIRGVLTSLLGADFSMNPHRAIYLNYPGTRSQFWHQDSVNARHYQIRCLLAMYYPQKVTEDMGPTALIPGTHFRNAPTDRMASYGNFKEQIFTTFDAGTVVIMHYDVWHAATANTSNKNRYMMKFLFDRQTDPISPNWNYTPEGLSTDLLRFQQEKICDSAKSDFGKERRLRLQLFHYLLGPKIKYDEKLDVFKKTTPEAKSRSSL